MLRGVPRCPYPWWLPLRIAHACRDMQKHVWTCICLQLFLNCIEKLSTNTALCISQKQPHTACPNDLPHDLPQLLLSLAFLSFPQALSLCFVAGQLTGQMTCTLFVCLLLVSSPSRYAPHLHIPDNPDICTICLLCPPFSSLPVVTFQGIHALFIFFYHIPPAAFLFRATLKCYKCR